MIVGGSSPPGNTVFSYGYVTVTAHGALRALSAVSTAGSSPDIAESSCTNFAAFESTGPTMRMAGPPEPLAPLEVMRPLPGFAERPLLGPPLGAAEPGLALAPGPV